MAPTEELIMLQNLTKDLITNYQNVLFIKDRINEIQLQYIKLVIDFAIYEIQQRFNIVSHLEYFVEACMSSKYSKQFQTSIRFKKICNNFFEQEKKNYAKWIPSLRLSKKKWDYDDVTSKLISRKRKKIYKNFTNIPNKKRKLNTN